MQAMCSYYNILNRSEKKIENYKLNYACVIRGKGADRSLEKMEAYTTD